MSYQNLETGETRSCGDYLKSTLTFFGFAGILGFFVLAALRVVADLKNTKSPVTWGLVVLPIAVAAVCLLLWTLVNYMTKAPIKGGDVSTGHGFQFYYNLLGQMLVKHLEVSSIETVNESYMLRDVLRFVVYCVIIAYSALAGTRTCNGCSVPYQMLAFGFLVAYLLRMLMLVYNGFYSYHRLKDMADEVRTYQESLDTNRLFFTSVKHLAMTSQRNLAMAVDVFLWSVSMAFAGLGMVWISNDTCKSTCGATFHIYNFLLIAVFAVEAASMLAKFALVYFERVSYIEGLDRLVSLIHEHHEKNELQER